jgi:hypothetical protein
LNNNMMMNTVIVRMAISLWRVPGYWMLVVGYVERALPVLLFR